MSQKIIILLLAIIAIFFSFYHLDKLYGFEFDQERDYYLVKSMVVDHKITLIGPRVVSSAGFYLGPWYYYLQIPFFILMHGNPIYGAVFTGFINVLICLTIFLVILQITKSKVVSFLAAVIWVSTANRSNWNVQFVPLFFLIYLSLYWRLRQHYRFLFLWLSTLTFTFALNFHPQMLFILPLWLIQIIHYRRKLHLKEIILLLFALLLPFSTLFIFDLRHQFVNTHAALNFLSSSSTKNSVISPFRFLYSLRQFSTATAFVYPNLQRNLILAGILLAIALISCLKFKKLFPFLVITLLSLLVLSFYREPTWPEYYHYLGGFSLFIFFCLVIAEFPKIKFLFLLLTLYLVYINFNFITTFVNPGSYYYKKAMILYMLSENKPYTKLNIINDFPYGEGLGFQPIREFYEKPNGQYPPNLKFFVAYAGNPKHNATKKDFGLYAISELR